MSVVVQSSVRNRMSMFGKAGSAAAVTVADPNLLTLAETLQTEDNTAYDALGVPAMAAGGSYADPFTGQLIYKVTDATTPVANSRAHTDYADFGPHISMPWVHGTTGNTMYTLHFIKEDGGQGYLADFDYTAGAFENYRTAPFDNMQGGFSSNPATPQIAYRIAGGSVRRYDTATDADDNTGFFPFTMANMTLGFQLLVDGNDEWITCQGGLSESPTHHGGSWNADTNVSWDWGASVPDEFRLDRNGNFAYELDEGGGSPYWIQNDLATGDRTDITTWIADFNDSHGATVKDYFVGIDPTTGGGPRLFYYEPVAHTRTWIGAGGAVAADHLAGQWVHGALLGLNQWVLSSGYNAGSAALLSQGIGFFQLNDSSVANVRLLCHHYTTSDKGDYYTQPHATMSPDGKIVMWESEMNVGGGARVDVFITKMPTA